MVYVYTMSTKEPYWTVNTAILDLWQHVSSALVRRVEKIKEI